VKKKQIAFRFKGTRDYIHGTDMFNVMMAESRSALTRNNIHLTIHDFVRTSICQLVITTSKESLNEMKDIAARCQLDLDGVTHWIGIAKDGKNNVSGERYTYDESRIISLCSMDGDGIVLDGLSPFSFIETVVAMNKHLHQQLFPEAIGKWIFTRLDLPQFCDVRENLALRFRHNMNFRLTKSEIEVDGRTVGDIFFSLVKT